MFGAAELRDLLRGAEQVVLPVGQFLLDPNSLQTLTNSFDFAKSKSSSGSTGVPPNLAPEILFSHLRLLLSVFFHFFDRSKNHQKSDLFQTLPKSQKLILWVPKARFWSHFG